jgi:hypothetical protein
MVVVAVTLVFDSGLIAPVTAELSHTTQSYLANAVGVSVAVEENELNSITAELTRREQELAQREQELEQREIEVGVGGTSEANASGANMSTYVLSAILFILLVLVSLNYAFDIARARKIEALQLHG